MATTGESSSLPSKDDKPVIVRVKRKAFQSCLDAFCEFNSLCLSFQSSLYGLRLFCWKHCSFFFKKNLNESLVAFEIHGYSCGRA